MNRRHDIDALRVLAFGLLILYHTGMLYVAPVADWRGLPLHSHYLLLWPQYPMLFVNRWRLELLFVISGLAIHFMRGRTRMAALAWKRTLRLLIPLIFAMLVVVPIQSYVAGLADRVIRPGFGAFLLHYWTHGYKDYGLTWAHLWYLPYLWVCTMLLLALLPALESPPGQRLRASCLQLRGASLLVYPVLPLFAYGVLLSWRYPETHALIGDWYALALYATMFFYGYVLGTDSGAWAELVRLRRTTLVLALVCFTAYLGLERFTGSFVHAHAALVVARLLTVWLHYSYTWIAITALLGWGHVLLNRPFRWLPYAREAVYPWYVLHQSLMLLFAWKLLPLALGPVAEPALILLGTIGGCALLHEYVIRRTRWLRPLFGLEAARAPMASDIVPTRRRDALPQLSSRCPSRSPDARPAPPDRARPDRPTPAHPDAAAARWR